MRAQVGPIDANRPINDRNNCINRVNRINPISRLAVDTVTQCVDTVR